MDLQATMRRLHTPADYLALACDLDSSDALLSALADCQYPFVWEALAANPRTPADVLARLCVKRGSPWSDSRRLLLIALHSRADRMVLLGVLGQLRDRLTVTESRPYAAVLALAGRPEIEAEEVQALGLLPGASARMRRGLKRRIGERDNNRA
jgi:hypothetical protein